MTGYSEVEYYVIDQTVNFQSVSKHLNYIEHWTFLSSSWPQRLLSSVDHLFIFVYYSNILVIDFVRDLSDNGVFTKW